MGSQDVYDRLRSERANPQGDVWFGGPSLIFAPAARDSLLDCHRPSWADAIAPRGRGDGDCYFAAYETPVVFLYAEKVVAPAEAPQNWDDLLEPQWKDKIIVPKVTRAQGKTLIAVVDNAQLGGPPQTTWGYQVLMQSNEGFPAKTDLLTRKVNEFEGQHRFGGGSDYDNDPHVMDILVPPGGDPAKKQYEILSKYNHNTKEPKPEDLAVVPMVYPNAGK